MQTDELDAWRNGIKEHMTHLDALVEDRKALKSILEEHLSQVFDWDDIEYNRDFTVVSLKYHRDHQPVIRNENLEKLMMDFQVKADYDNDAYRIVVIDVYPFGVD